MKTSFPLPLDRIADLCRRYDVVELCVSGSVLRPDFTAESDVDFLVTFLEGTNLGPWMARYFEFEEELSCLLGRPLDLVMRRSLEQSENYIRREQILKTAERVFAAR